MPKNIFAKLSVEAFCAARGGHSKIKIVYSDGVLRLSDEDYTTELIVAGSRCAIYVGKPVNIICGDYCAVTCLPDTPGRVMALVHGLRLNLRHCEHHRSLMTNMDELAREYDTYLRMANAMPWDPFWLHVVRHRMCVSSSFLEISEYGRPA